MGPYLHVTWIWHLFTVFLGSLTESHCYERMCQLGNLRLGDTKCAEETINTAPQ